MRSASGTGPRTFSGAGIILSSFMIAGGTVNEKLTGCPSDVMPVLPLLASNAAAVDGADGADTVTVALLRGAVTPEDAADAANVFAPASALL